MEDRIENPTTNNIDPPEKVILKYLEFYSGIGGWGLALQQACSAVSSRKNDNSQPIITARRIAAFDHSDLANSVLSHNSHTSCSEDEKGSSLPSPDLPKLKKQKREESRKKKDKAKRGTGTIAIERLTVKQLSNFGAHIWVMSPPCQPYSRNNETTKRDKADPRSKSFLHLCQVLTEMKKDDLPFLILMENVIGFESSDCCITWRETLSTCGYNVGHFHISPVQVGIPNDRPRYYCAAVRRNEKHVQFLTESSCYHDLIAKLSAYISLESTNPISNNVTTQSKEKSTQKEKNENESDTPIFKIHTSIPEIGVGEDKTEAASLPSISTFLDDDLKTPDSPSFNVQKLDSLRIPAKILGSNSSWCFDIVTPQNSRSSCFTHSYGRFVRGTGSVLYMTNNLEYDVTMGGKRSAENRLVLKPPEEREFDKDWAKGLNLEKKLRYFSGSEVARLMGFPIVDNHIQQRSPKDSPNIQESTQSIDKTETAEKVSFTFPSSISLKQQWKLLGNSLNVCVASKIAEIGLYLSMGQNE